MWYAVRFMVAVETMFVVTSASVRHTTNACSPCTCKTAWHAISTAANDSQSDNEPALTVCNGVTALQDRAWHTLISLRRCSS